MANLPAGSSVLPGVTTLIQTNSTGVSVPGGTRLALIVGTGARTEIIVASAVGNDNDGLNPTFTSTSGRDGRHFALSQAPIVSNRTQLFKNGVPLVGLEQIPDTSSFSNSYDYRIDIATGHIELQKAYLIDQGGKFYTTGSTNVGLGNLDGYGGPTLVDLNAPTETWNIKCVSVQRNGLGQPIQNTAKFLAFGSVSGVQLDAFGNPVTWLSNGQQVSNGIIKFAISETQVLGVSTSPFREGDFFTVQVKSGALNKNDSLTATYIAVGDLEDPEFFTSIDPIITKHGAVTLDNTISLGAELAFANTPPGVYAMQAKPPLPRRTSIELEPNFDSTSTNVNEFVLPLPLGVVPDINSNIHFFVTDPVTKVETQLLPNKFPFYTLDTAGNPTTSQFVFSDVNPPGGWSFSYSVNQSSSVLAFGDDGYINRSLTSQTLAAFSVAGTTFTAVDVGKQLEVFDGYNLTNNGTWNIIGVTNGICNIQAAATPPFSDFVNGTGITFHLVNPVTGLPVPGNAADGYLVAIPNTATGTFGSNSVGFTGIANITGLKLSIDVSATASNVGLFDILSIDGGTGDLTIAKSFVAEHNLDYRILDSSATTNYVVVNHNIVPANNDLRITLVDERDASFYDAGWVDALLKLETIEIDILVPLPRQTMSVIFQNFQNHCITMSNLRNKKERVLFTGAINGLTPDNLTGATPAAVEDIGILEGIQGNTVAEILAGNTEDLTNYSVPDAFGSTFRTMYFWPDQIVAVVGGENTIIDGFYIAAAAAGLVSGTANIAMPLTNKVISGFTILRNKTLSITVQEQLVAAGVCVLQPVAGGGRVVWGKTTTQSGFPEEEEMSIVFIRDRIAKSFRSGFAGFIGLPDDPDTIPMITTRAVGLLKSFINAGIITDYANLSVRRDSVEPRQINVIVQVQPNYPVNWIFVRVGVGVI